MHIRSTEITITDPREFEGDPYQVAESAIRQATALLDIASTQLDKVDLMVRNAALQREIDLGNATPEHLREVAQGWPESPQGSKLRIAQQELRDAGKHLSILARAAAYNPKSKVSK